MLTSVLFLTAGAAALAAPRLLPVAETEPVVDETPVIEAEAGESLLTEEDAVTDAAVIEEAVEIEPVQPPAIPMRRASRDVDVVIALDTSGSMEGLLDSARARLWDIVDEVSEREPDANLRVGLVTFGSPGVSGANEGFVKVRSDLTTDLDSLYAQVMALHTDGGDEYVGWTIHTAVSTLSWSGQSNAVKIMFIAGNESADQGRSFHDFRTATAQARERGIKVNAMFAGDHGQGSRERWQQVANAGGGFYSAIDQAVGTHQIATPHDHRLEALNRELNNTYVGYGSGGEAGRARQLAQDENAMRMGAASSGSRIATKSRRQYDNSGWDLLDGLKKGKVALDSMDEDDLPAELVEMEEEERQAWVDEMTDRRDQIQMEIATEAKKRKAFIDQNKGEAAEGGLDEAVMDALEAQL